MSQRAKVELPRAGWHMMSNGEIVRAADGAKVKTGKYLGGYRTEYTAHLPGQDEPQILCDGWMQAIDEMDRLYPAQVING